MIPKIVHQTAPQMGLPERWLLTRNRRVLTDCAFRFYDDAANRALVERLLPARLALYDALRSGVIRADIARCLYLHAQGGLYCDTDYYFLRNPGEAFWANSCVLGVEEPENRHMNGEAKLGNAVMASVPGHPLWLGFVEHIFERFAHEGAENIVLLSGPVALSRFVAGHPALAADVTILPQPVLYPPFGPLKLTGRAQAATMGVHLCWGSWRAKAPLNKITNRTRRYLSAAIARFL